MNTKLRYLCVAVCASLALVGCAPGDSAGTSSDGNSDQPVVEDSQETNDATTPEEVDLPTDVEEEPPIEADEDIMATMTCEPFGEGSEELNMMFGYFNRAVSVEVGKNNGRTWWVVIFEWDGEGGTAGLREAYLTDALGQASYRDGMWIRLRDSDRWHDVDWDHDMLVRGQSALEVAREALASS